MGKKDKVGRKRERTRKHSQPAYDENPTGTNSWPDMWLTWDALLPYSIQRWVAKLVDSARLKP